MEEILLKKTSSISGKLIIPEEVQKKIDLLCNKIYLVEWSGILFFSYEGSFMNNNLKIICKDILLMDIGNSTYTEFDMSPEIIGYMTDNNLLDYQMGLIHSHNQMSTFFSHTDLDTLIKQGNTRNNFVSLIVNNAGEYTAAITRKVQTTITKANFTYNFFSDGEVKEEQEINTKEEELEYCLLTIEKPEVDDSLNKLIGRIEEIKERNKNTNTIYKYYNPQPTYPNNNASNKDQDLFSKLEREVKDSPVIAPTANKEEQSTNKFPYLNNYDDTIIPYGEIKADKNIVNSVLYQLLTGNILLASNTNIDINKWVNSMTSLFDKRFGNTKNGMSSYITWAANHIDAVLGQTIDNSLLSKGYDAFDTQAIIAYDVIERLEELPSNKYIKELINILEESLI